mgnify:CR=1 FL=1
MLASNRQKTLNGGDPTKIPSGSIGYIPEDLMPYAEYSSQDLKVPTFASCSTFATLSSRVGSTMISLSSFFCSVWGFSIFSGMSIIELSRNGNPLTEMRLLLLVQIYVVLTPIFVFDAFAKTPGGVVKDKE